MSHKFNLFWQVYPRKVAKKAALNAWEKNNCESIADEVIQAVNDQIKYTYRDTEKQYIPHPATWLNGMEMGR